MSQVGKKVQHNVLITAHRRELLLRKVLNSQFVREADNLVIAIDGPDESQDDSLARSNIFKVIEEASLPKSTEIYEANARLGLYAAMRRALDYGFVKFPHLTVLEEDCLPSEETKSYIHQVRSILGNEQTHICLSRHVRSSLIFKRNVVTKTRYPFVWGWHTSDEIWHKSRGLVKDIDDYELIAKLRQLPSWNQHFEDFWLMMLQSCKDVENARDAGALDSLDYTIGMRRWVKNSWATPYVLNYWMFSETLGALRPPINLVENIGFGDLATHTTRRPPHARKLETRRLNSLSLDADEKTNLDYAEDRIVFGVQP